MTLVLCPVQSSHFICDAAGRVAHFHLGDLIRILNLPRLSLDDGGFTDSIDSVGSRSPLLLNPASRVYNLGRHQT
jgi:hypothetical protein